MNIYLAPFTAASSEPDPLQLETKLELLCAATSKVPRRDAFPRLPGTESCE